MAGRISLVQAIEQYGREEGALVYAYGWYRKQAQASGAVSIGGSNLPALKLGGRWTVESADLAAAIKAHHAHYQGQLRARGQADAEYEARQLRPGTVATSWGGYTVNGAFHFVWSDYERQRHRTDGAWKCNSCWQPASTERERAECHTCSDWGGCGTDCTLSRVYCQACATSLAV